MFALFLNHLYQGKIAKRIILFSIPAFIIFALSNFIFSGAGNFSKTPFIVEFLAFIVALIFFFYEKIKTVILYPIDQSISFWICVGLFLYFTGNFFYLLFVQSSSDLSSLHFRQLVYGTVTISKNLILGLALFANEPKEDQNDELQIPPDINLDEFILTNANKF